MSRFTGILLGTLIVLALGAITVANAAVAYEAILEWNGPYFKIINNATVDQMVDDPVADIPFVQPYAVAAVEHPLSGCDRAYVVDSGHNRVQAFEVNGSYYSDNSFTATTTATAGYFDWATTFTPARDKIYLAEYTTVATSTQYVLPGSESVVIGGSTWAYVADMTGFVAADKVYNIDYDATSTVITVPDGSLTATSEISLRYALSNYRGTLPTQFLFGSGDVDYGLDNAVNGSRVMATINEATGGPSSWGVVRSIAVVANEANVSSDDVFLLDAVDGTEKLFSYLVSTSTVAAVEKYDDVLTGPYDVAVANGGPLLEVAAAAASTAGALVTAATVVDASQVTGHSYRVTNDLTNIVITDLSITPNTTLMTAATSTVSVAACYVIPGISLAIAVASTTPATVTTTKAIPDRYLFVADTGADRIKVIAASDNAVTADATGVPGNDWLPGDVHSVEAKPTSAIGGAATTGWVDYNTSTFLTPSTVPEDWSVYTLASPIKEGTLATISMSSPALAPTWTRIDDLVTAGTSDQVYAVDWTSGKITFGDGIHGRIPDPGALLTFTYTTTPDVLRYGSSGSGPGRFSAPRGIAARWNSSLGVYDVYVVDTGNNRIQKLAFTPADAGLNLPARMDFVCEWNDAGTDVLDNPVDIAVAKDAAGGTTGKVYLAVADQGNNRIATYLDVAATSGGGSTAPTWEAVSGVRGNSLGLYMQIDGVCFLPNGQDLDIYACDGQRGVVTKYEKSVAPVITLNLTNLGSGFDPCRAQSGSYDFTFTTENPPVGGHIEFWYSQYATFDEATAELCFPADSILATATTARWTFANTPPPGAPADRSIAAGGYYLFARMKDASGILVADDASSTTSANERLCMDSTLLPGFRGVDRIDGDRTLYLQNDLERVVNLTLAFPKNVIGVAIGGTFPDSTLEVTAINPGNGWDNTGYINPIFNQAFTTGDTDVANPGIFLVNTSITGSPIGLDGNGPFVMAEMTVKSHATVLNPTTRRFLDGTIAILQAKSSMVDTIGITPATALWTTRNVSLRWGYLGDLATNGTGADSTLPYLVVDPDGLINFEDQMVLTLGWNGVGNVQDPIADIGPTEGAVPNLRPIPDGKWDVEDLLAFTVMYSWAAGEGFYKDASGLLRTTEPRPAALGAPVLGSAAVRSVSVLGMPKTGELMTVDLNVDNVRDLSGALINVGFDPARLELVSVENGGFLDGKSGSLFFKKSGQGWLEISTTRLDQKQPGVNGSGTVAHATFRILDENAGDLSVQYDLRSATGKVVGRGKSQAGAYTGSAVGFQLYAAHPNPTRGNANIVYSVPTATALSLDVYDVTGRHVRSLFSGRREAGYHVAPFDGRDDAGNSLAGGIYFYRLQANGKTATQKLTLSR